MTIIGHLSVKMTFSPIKHLRMINSTTFIRNVFSVRISSYIVPPPSLNTLKEEAFAGRNFRVFAVFGLFRESFFREIFQNLSTAKVYSTKFPIITAGVNFCRAYLIYPTHVTEILNLIGWLSLNRESLSREIYQNCATAKVSSREMHKFRGQAEPRKFLPAKVSSFKVI